MGSYASINNREALVAFCAATDGVIGLPDGATEGASGRRGRGGGLRCVSDGCRGTHRVQEEREGGVSRKEAAIRGLE